MRVLLTHHFPLSHAPTGRLLQQWAQGLLAAGHEVRLLLVDRQHQFGESLAIERVVCGDDPNADLTFPLPHFSTAGAANGGIAFAGLSDAQLAQYRERLRRRLDIQVLQFDPHIIHSQHVWVLGQLALESGVPYVLSAWGEELVDAQLDERYRVLAEQAAENASRILAADESVRRDVTTLFESVGERTVVMPELWLTPSEEADDAALVAIGHDLHALYDKVLVERFG